MTDETFAETHARTVREIAEAGARAMGGLFGEPVARHTDPETSHAAADDARRTCGAGRRIVLKYLTVEPMTDFELADRTGWQQTSIGKRRGECVQAGWVAVVWADGAKLTRPAPSGSAALVWQITATGRGKLREIEG